MKKNIKKVSKKNPEGRKSISKSFSRTTSSYIHDDISGVRRIIFSE